MTPPLPQNFLVNFFSQFGNVRLKNRKKWILLNLANNSQIVILDKFCKNLRIEIFGLKLLQKSQKVIFCSPLPKYSQTRFRTLAKKALKTWFLLTQANFYILDLLLRHLQIFDFLLKYLQTIRILLTKTFATLAIVTLLNIANICIR